MSGSFDFSVLLSFGLRITVAYLLALPIGWDRERSAGTLGLRTFPLVSAASAAYVLLGLEVFANDAEAQSRVVQGLMTGIGFVGAGAILKGEEAVHGTATAASIWATGALGAASAYGRFELALLIGLVTFVTFRWLTPLKKHVDGAVGREEREEPDA